ncbi:CPBP family glutamic-type intramembrane protease [Fulvivirga lutimaris]|uniref:CPBP family glutamic-type intramembrane protease n=1 Tax=Fulvivirga lutimaris TaxID=1819566 RepID=UPI0012BC1CB0|nr:CPBP family glutamic-type intramembrane protease [Fulvivirga lutimaris]MTI39431.1 hypothetical protein [Fulvivirga lutimaris]
MEEIMQSNSFFIVPLTLAYGAICASWFLVNAKTKWPISTIHNSNKPKTDFIISLIAAVAVIVIGQIYSAGFLIPTAENHILQGVIWMLNNVIIFSPILLTLSIRKQSLNTLFISKEKLWLKLAFGIATSILGVIIFIGLRGEWNRFIPILTGAFEYKALTNFPAIFFENMILAFLFVRLKWILGTKWAIIIPAILFAFAHVPGSIAEGDPWSHILTFFILTGSLTTFILYTAYRSRDIIWLGVVHYMMDIVIKAF